MPAKRKKKKGGAAPKAQPQSQLGIGKLIALERKSTTGESEYHLVMIAAMTEKNVTVVDIDQSIETGKRTTVPWYMCVIVAEIALNSKQKRALGLYWLGDQFSTCFYPGYYMGKGIDAATRAQVNHFTYDDGDARPIYKFVPLFGHTVPSVIPITPCGDYDGTLHKLVRAALNRQDLKRKRDAKKAEEARQQEEAAKVHAAQMALQVQYRKDVMAGVSEEEIKAKHKAGLAVTATMMTEQARAQAQREADLKALGVVGEKRALKGKNNNTQGAQKRMKIDQHPSAIIILDAPKTAAPVIPPPPEEPSEDEDSDVEMVDESQFLPAVVERPSRRPVTPPPPEQLPYRTYNEIPPSVFPDSRPTTTASYLVQFPQVLVSLPSTRSQYAPVTDADCEMTGDADEGYVSGLGAWHTYRDSKSISANELVVAPYVLL